MENSIEYGLLLKSHTPERAQELISQRYSIYGSQKPILVLHDKQDPAPASAAKRRRKSKINADLEQFLAAPHTYEQYGPLNRLWKGYIATVMAGHLDANKLLTADWHGAEISVIASKSPGFVGKQGILLWEARTQLIIVTPQNKLYKIPKKGCVFKMHGLDQQVHLVGTRLLCRSAERTTRKFKPRDTADIASLIPYVHGR